MKVLFRFSEPFGYVFSGCYANNVVGVEQRVGIEIHPYDEGETLWEKIGLTKSSYKRTS